MVVLKTVEMVYPEGGCSVDEAVTGQTVVYRLMSSVVVEPRGQLVTVAGHFVIV